MDHPLILHLVVPLIKIIVILAVLLLIVAYMTLAERKIMGYIQVRIGPNRVGPRGLLQPFADGIKLFLKEDLMPARAQKLVFVIAPALIIAPAFVVFSVIPFGGEWDFWGLLPETSMYITDINIGLLFILGVSSIGVYGIILGGWASNNKFSLMGGLRSAAQMISYEVPMGFAIVSVLLMAGSLSLVQIVEVQRDLGLWFFIPGWLALGIYFLCGVAETNRNPFDLPEAESELVGGFHTEYSGMKFALFFLGEYANMVVVSSLAVVMFFGGWLPPFPNWLGFLWENAPFVWVPPFCWFLGKVAFFVFVYMWFRSTFPRYRFDQLMKIGWKWLIPLSLANLLLVALGIRLLKEMS